MVTKKKAAPKKAAKKAASTVKSTFNFWLLSSNIENISMDVERVKDLLELVAESMFEHKSNVIWLAADLLEKEVQNLNKLAEEVMGIHRENNSIKK